MSKSIIEPVGDRDKFKEGGGKIIEFDGKKVAVILSDGVFYALENACPHQGGPLGDGKVEGTKVYCPWHGYEFDLATGEHTHLSMCVNTYSVFVEDGTVYVTEEG